MSDRITADAILAEAQGLLVARAPGRDIGGQRAMARAVAAFNCLFGDAVAARGGRLSETEGNWLMVLIKAARGDDPDNPRDAAAYVALAGEAQARDRLRAAPEDRG